jgi:hypothetical protein
VSPRSSLGTLEKSDARAPAMNRRVQGSVRNIGGASFVGLSCAHFCCREFAISRAWQFSDLQPVPLCYMSVLMCSFNDIAVRSGHAVSNGGTIGELSDYPN